MVIFECETLNNKKMIYNDSFFYTLYKATFQEKKNEQIRKC